MSDSDDEVDWLEAASEVLEAAGFVRTPPELDHDPTLDMDALHTSLLELQSDLKSAPELQDFTTSAPEPLPDVAGTFSRRELSAPFTDATLRRAYADCPCETLVITFGGLTAAGHARVLTPGVAQHELVGSCTRLGVKHALFVRDLLQSWYLRRPPSTGQDPCIDCYDPLISLLRVEIAALQPKHIVTVGASMGGYAAIRAGVMLGATTAIAFGPQVILAPCERRLLGLPLGVMDTPLEALQREADAQVVPLESLIALMGSAPLLGVAPSAAANGTGVPELPSCTIDMHVCVASDSSNRITHHHVATPD